MSLIRWSIVAVLAVLLAVLARLPASQIKPQLEGLGLYLDDVSGTVWNGRATRISYHGMNLGSARWRLSPLPLLLLQARAEVEVLGSEITGSGHITRYASGAVELEDFEAGLPAQWLQRILNEPFLGLDGRVTLDIEQLRVDKNGWLQELNGVSRWRNAALTGRLTTGLGELSGVWQTEVPGIILGRLEDQGGALMLNGSVTVNQKSYRVELELGARGDNIPLRQALQVLGNPDQDGKVTLKITGPMLPIGGNS